LIFVSRAFQLKTYSKAKSVKIPFLNQVLIFAQPYLA
jgi:hypothetical protein